MLENPELAKTETFNDLNKALQEELLHLITWGERASQQIMGPPPEGFSRILNLSNMRLQDNVREQKLVPSDYLVIGHLSYSLTTSWRAFL